MQASDRHFAFSNDKNLHSPAKTCKRSLAVLLKFSICEMKERLLSIVIPRGFLKTTDQPITYQPTN